MKISENFDIRELVHPDIYNHPAIGSRAADFIHPYLPLTLEALKANLKEVITVNNWSFGGGFVDSGLRLPNGSVGAALSSHRFGVAADLKFKHHSIQEVQEHILGNQTLYPYITRIEGLAHTPTWCHIEVGNRDGNIVIFNP